MKDVGECDQARVALYLIDFARKWECQPILEMIERGIACNIREPTRGDLFEQFLLAFDLGKYELAADCLRYQPAMNWVLSEPSAADTRALSDLPALGGHNVFDLSASHYSIFTDVPSEAVWALLRSWNIAKNTSSEEAFETVLGDEFLKIMRMARKWIVLLPGKTADDCRPPRCGRHLHWIEEKGQG
jgi:hypothetical protein